MIMVSFVSRSYKVAWTKRPGWLVLPQEQLAAYQGAGQLFMLHSEVKGSVKPFIRWRKQIRRPHNVAGLIEI